MAGHSKEVFEKFYNTQAAHAAQVLVTALQDQRDTISPIASLNFPNRTMVGMDMRERRDAVQQEAKSKLEARKNSRGNQDNPVTEDSRNKLIIALISINPALSLGGRKMSDIKWLKMILPPICKNWNEIGHILEDIFYNDQELLMSYVVKVCQKKMGKREKLSDIDSDALIQLMIWVKNVM